ncbi:MAG TPA: hypothetical protein VKN36_08395 [Eudoraea sp.]|nr:hypothetical protein [Eudoraea sp.]
MSRHFSKEEELKHPYYWAGFVVVGDNAAISTEPYRYWALTGIGLVVLVLFVFRTRLVKILQ